MRGVGLLLGLELVKPDGSPARTEAERVMYACLARGLSFKVGQGNVITLSPPLVIAERDLDRAFDILDEAIGEVEASPGGERRAAPGSPAPSGGSAPDARRGEGN